MRLRHHPSLLLTALAALLPATGAGGAPRGARPFPPSRPAASARQTPPALLALVREMLQAQNRLALEGTMVSEMPQGTFVQYAVLDGAHAQRYDCQSPPANRGEVIVDNGRARYHTTPAGHVDVLPSQMAARRVRVSQVMQEVRRGNLLVQPLGQGIVAGHACTIIRIGSPDSVEYYQYWIDPSNGAQLRIEQYDDAGHRESATYFTDVTYNPPLDRRLFQAPVSAATPPAASRSAPLPTVPTAAQAGFAVLQPSTLPPGFHFQSATLVPRKGRILVKLTYGNGLNALTLVETPDLRPLGPRAGQIRNPRPGVVLTRRDGLVIVLVGSLDVGSLESVLNSVR